MKKIFFGFTYLILSTVTLIYLSITRTLPNDAVESITSATAFTGLPIIAIILIIPTLVLNILALILDRKVLNFCKEMVTFFAGAFSLGTAIVGFFYFPAYYIPVVIGICSLALLIMSLVQIVKTLKESDKNKNNEAL